MSSTARYALYCGYQIEVEDFKAIVATLKCPCDYLSLNPTIENDPGPTLGDYLATWGGWKDTLESKVRTRLPCVILRHRPEAPFLAPLDQSTENIMFTFRFFDFTDPSQESPGHPNYKALTEPRPVEREVFNRFLAYIEGNSKLKVDRDRIKWTYLKEVHPRDHNILFA